MLLIFDNFKSNEPIKIASGFFNNIDILKESNESLKNVVYFAKHARAMAANMVWLFSSVFGIELDKLYKLVNLPLSNN